ncbi:enoyl-CoA hydratase-related protein [Cryptosporangium minutisporangium]|uniref:Enoyl-CoA hydratase family protein n=1 Tax=Cryptosporangium minutisporangium TaxID=113569 RepID=A0ABP6TDZ5_9ACTN
MEQSTMGASAPADAGRPLVRTRLDGAVAVVMLDSPANRNALSLPVVNGLIDAMHTAAQNEEVRVVVLVSEGEVFCAGADFTELTEPGDHDPTACADALLTLLRTMVELPKPIVTRVHGEAVAAGLALVGASDLVISERSATYGFTETRIGLAPALASLTTLPRIAPRAAARAYLTGVTIDAGIAEEIGLVSQVVDDEMLDAAVDFAVASLLAGSPGALAATKEMLTRPIRANLAENGPDMVKLWARLCTSAEAGEGIAALVESRRPAWAVPD